MRDDDKDKQLNLNNTVKKRWNLYKVKSLQGGALSVDKLVK